jgi:hypothetical protein
MKHTSEVETAIRMVGQLLLHRPTTGTMFRDKEGKDLVADACPDEPLDLPRNIDSFCFVGAVKATGAVLHLVQDDLWDTCCDILNQESLDGDMWDRATIAQQNRWAKKLVNYKETK